MASFEFLAIIVSVLGLAASITYYAIVLANANRTRQAQIIMQVYQKMTDPAYNDLFWEVMLTEWDSPEEYMKTESFRNLSTILNYFESVAILLQRGLIPRDLVYDFFPTNVNVLCDKYEQVFDYIRVENNQPDYRNKVLYLADMMEKERVRQGDPEIGSYNAIKNPKT